MRHRGGGREAKVLWESGDSDSKGPQAVKSEILFLVVQEFLSHPVSPHRGRGEGPKAPADTLRSSFNAGQHGWDGLAFLS